MNPKAGTSTETNSQTGFNLVGLIGFTVSAVSATLSIMAILIWRYYAAMDLDLEGGGAFSAYLVPNLITMAGMGIGVVGLIIATISIATARKRTRCGIDFIHVLSGVLLAPAVYLMVRLFC